MIDWLIDWLIVTNNSDSHSNEWAVIIFITIRLLRPRWTKVNRGDWLWSPANIKEANRDAKTYIGRFAILHNLLFCSYTLYNNYVTSTFLLVSSSVRSKQLSCFVQGQSQKREQSHTIKNVDEFHNHSPFLTMAEQTGNHI